MALVILIAENPEDFRHELAEAMLKHIERRAIKQLNEDTLILVRNFNLEVGVESLPIEFNGLFKNGRVDHWKNGYSRDSGFKKQKRFYGGQFFCKKIIAPVRT